MSDNMKKAAFPAALVLSVAIDRISKYAAVRYCAAASNGGASFGALSGSGLGTLTTLNIAVALLMVVYCAVFLKRGSTSFRTGCGMLLGGTLSNLADRLLSGGVTDWLLVPLSGMMVEGGIKCNAADVFLTVGAIMILVEYSKHPDIYMK